MHALQSLRVAWDVYFTAVAEEWILGLDDDDYFAMLAAIELLEVHGPSLGRPAVDRIDGSRHHNMKGVALFSAATCARCSRSTRNGARSC